MEGDRELAIHDFVFLRGAVTREIIFRNLSETGCPVKGRKGTETERLTCAISSHLNIFSKAAVVRIDNPVVSFWNNVITDRRAGQ